MPSLTIIGMAIPSLRASRLTALWLWPWLVLQLLRLSRFELAPHKAGLSGPSQRHQFG